MIGTKGHDIVYLRTDFDFEEEVFGCLICNVEGACVYLELQQERNKVHVFEKRIERTEKELEKLSKRVSYNTIVVQSAENIKRVLKGFPSNVILRYDP
jgi:hypothetical protein